MIIQIIIYKIQFFTLLASAAIVSFQHELFMLDRGVELTIALLVFGAGQITTMITNITVRKYTDKLDSNKLLQISLCMRTLVMVAMFFTTNSTAFIALYLIYVFFSSFGFIFESAAAAWAVEKKVSFASLRIYGSLGFAIAGLMVTYLYNLTGVLNYVLLFLAFLNGINAYISIKKPFDIKPKKKNEAIEKVDVHTRVILILCAIITVMPGAFSVVLNNAYRYQFGLDVYQALLFSSIAVLLGSFISEFIGFKTVDKLIKKIRPHKTILLGIVLSLLRWVTTVIAPTYWTLTLTFAFHGFIFAYVYLGVLAYIRPEITTKAVMEWMIFSNIINFLLVQLTNLLLNIFPNVAVPISFVGFNIIVLLVYLAIYKKTRFRYVSPAK